MVSKWPGGTKLNKGQIDNFISAYKLYKILYKAYRGNPPKDVDPDFWQNKVIQAFNAQVYFNLPQRQEVLYRDWNSRSGQISINALGQKIPTKEHFHPRRPWVKWRLFDIPKKVTLEKFFDLYCKEGGRYNKTTKEENADLETWYHDQGDPKPTKKKAEQAYKETNIKLVDDPKIKAAEKKRKSSVKQKGVGRGKAKRHCGKCGRTGHNKKTCKNKKKAATKRKTATKKRKTSKR